MDARGAWRLQVTWRWCASSLKHAAIQKQGKPATYPEGVTDARHPAGPRRRRDEEAVAGLGGRQLGGDGRAGHDEELGEELPGLVGEGVVALEERRAVPPPRQPQRIGATYTVRCTCMDGWMYMSWTHGSGGIGNKT